MQGEDMQSKSPKLCGCNETVQRVLGLVSKSRKKIFEPRPPWDPGAWAFI